VYDPPMTLTILSGRWVGNTGCPAKSSTKGGHPSLYLIISVSFNKKRNVKLVGVYFCEHASTYALKVNK
jgi:hypothetical protein